jgi:hypothetical protein
MYLQYDENEVKQLIFLGAPKNSQSLQDSSFFMMKISDGSAVNAVGENKKKEVTLKTLGFQKRTSSQ